MAVCRSYDVKNFKRICESANTTISQKVENIEDPTLTRLAQKGCSEGRRHSDARRRLFKSTPNLSGHSVDKPTSMLRTSKMFYDEEQKTSKNRLHHCISKIVAFFNRSTSAQRLYLLPSYKPTCSTYRGYLEKKNKKKWERFYCVIQDFRMHFCSSHTSKVCFDVIELCNYDVIANARELNRIRLTFCLKKKGSPTLRFCTTDHEKFQYWIDTLVKVTLQPPCSTCYTTFESETQWRGSEDSFLSQENSSSLESLSETILHTEESNEELCSIVSTNDNPSEVVVSVHCQDNEKQSVFPEDTKNLKNFLHNRNCLENGKKSEANQTTSQEIPEEAKANKVALTCAVKPKEEHDIFKISNIRKSNDVLMESGTLGGKGEKCTLKGSLEDLKNKTVKANFLPNEEQKSTPCEIVSKIEESDGKCQKGKMETDEKLEKNEEGQQSQNEQKMDKLLLRVNIASLKRQKTYWRNKADSCDKVMNDIVNNKACGEISSYFTLALKRKGALVQLQKIDEKLEHFQCLQVRLLQDAEAAAISFISDVSSVSTTDFIKEIEQNAGDINQRMDTFSNGDLCKKPNVEHGLEETTNVNDAITSQSSTKTIDAKVASFLIQSEEIRIDDDTTAQRSLETSIHDVTSSKQRMRSFVGDDTPSNQSAKTITDVTSISHQPLNTTVDGITKAQQSLTTMVSDITTSQQSLTTISEYVRDSQPDDKKNADLDLEEEGIMLARSIAFLTQKQNSFRVKASYYDREIAKSICKKRYCGRWDFNELQARRREACFYNRKLEDKIESMKYKQAKIGIFEIVDLPQKVGPKLLKKSFTENRLPKAVFKRLPFSYHLATDLHSRNADYNYVSVRPYDCTKSEDSTN